MSYKVIAAGSGGQGVQFVGKFFASYGLKQGFNVTYLPSYGAEMRGGATDAQIIFSKEEISMPIISRIDALLLLSPLSVDKFIGKLEPDATLIYNSDMMKAETIKEKYPECTNVIPVAANTISKELGYKDIVNIPFIYNLIKNNKEYDEDHIKRALEEILVGKEKFIIGNMEYFKKLESL